MSRGTKTTYTLEMIRPADLRPKEAEISGLRIERMETPCPEFNKFLHKVVGYDCLWGGRHDWGEKKWRAHVSRDELETWVAYVFGTPAGYFELEKQPDGEVRILVFGLFRQFIGQGLGGHLLTTAVRRAWELGDKKVRLSTCTHDHAHALKNYLARGFRIQNEVQRPANPPVKSFWELMTPEY